MSSSKSVNIDAMIPRADLAVQGETTNTADLQSSIGLRDLIKGSLLLPNLRKPDFQRETNHWASEQVVALIQSFIDGDLIPAVILWRSDSYVFVIDGGHRISALRAWVEDDYGDGYSSQKLYGNEITKDQKKIAERTRIQIKKRVGEYADWVKLNEESDNSLIDEVKKQRLKNFSTRTVPIQWVPGDVDKAEKSFFKINTKGTPLDDIEETLIKNRRKPIAIVARSIIRAGHGHKYWSAFDDVKKQEIESLSKDINSLLFEPEPEERIRTLDLPLGGVAGVRNALKLLMELALVSTRDHEGKPYQIEDQDDDSTGDATIMVLKNIKRLISRITGPHASSLGLHPAIYFYSAAGKYSLPMFMGMSILLARKIVTNDKPYFKKFTNSREILETFIVENKHLIATISQQFRSTIRNEYMSKLLGSMIDKIHNDGALTAEQVIELAGFEGSVLTKKVGVAAEGFKEDTKNAVFIKNAIASALECPICKGKIPGKSMSFDHIVPKRDGGTNSEENCQPTHHFCNTGMKN